MDENRKDIIKLILMVIGLIVIKSINKYELMDFFIQIINHPTIQWPND